MDPFAPLAERYGPIVPVVRREAGTHPVAVEKVGVGAGGGDRGADELVALTQPGTSALAPLDERLRAAGERHREMLSRRGRRMHDGAVLALDTVGDGIVAAARSSYFAMLATCDSLRAEYLEAIGGSPARPLSLPLRDLADAAAAPGDPLRCGAGRAAAIGVSVITTLPGPAGRAFLVGRRRSDLATDPGQWHVAPSGMLEPSMSGDPLVPTVRTELSEELGIELAGRDGALGSRLEVLGLAYDLLRLRPEICLRLDLTSAEGDRAITPPAGPWPTGRGAPVHASGDLPEFDALELIELSPPGLQSFWDERPPGSVTAPAAGAVALLEIVEAGGRGRP